MDPNASFHFLFHSLIPSHSMASSWRPSLSISMRVQRLRFWGLGSRFRVFIGLGFCVSAGPAICQV